MKNTLTITFHSSENNGSFLQAFALQKVLSDTLGVNNRIIDFRSDIQIKHYGIFRPLNSTSNIVKNFVSLCHYRSLKKRKKRFENMQRKHLQLTDRCSQEEEVLALSNTVDICFVGSDQIWNTKAFDFSKAYFLPNTSVKKVAYAVSCGSKAETALLTDWEESIKDFSLIAVREAAMQPIVENLYEKSVDVVLDPTLLLDAQSYDCLYTKDKKINGKYIFLYSINYNKDILTVAKRISKQFGMPVVTVFTCYSAVFCSKYGIKVLWNAVPSDFLNLLHNASIVVTNSFHGTVFSTIFKKPFFHVCEESEGKRVRDDRIGDFLDSVQLSKQSVTLSTEMEYFEQNLEIDWQTAFEKLEQERKKSLQYLQKTLE